MTELTPKMINDAMKAMDVMCRAFEFRHAKATNELKNVDLDQLEMLLMSAAKVLTKCEKDMKRSMGEVKGMGPVAAMETVSLHKGVVEMSRLLMKEMKKRLSKKNN